MGSILLLSRLHSWLALVTHGCAVHGWWKLGVSLFTLLSNGYTKLLNLLSALVPGLKKNFLYTMPWAI